MRTPFGHPEGFIEAFANVYREGFKTIRAQVKGAPDPKADHPTVDDGVTGLEIEELCAEVSSFIPGHPLDDDSMMLLHFKGGAKGILYASQVSSGEENGLTIRVYGTKKGLQ